MHRAVRTPKAHTCPINEQKSRRMSWIFAYFCFISPPAGGETLRGLFLAIAVYPFEQAFFDSLRNALRAFLFFWKIHSSVMIYQGRGY